MTPIFRSTNLLIVIIAEVLFQLPTTANAKVFKFSLKKTNQLVSEAVNVRANEEDYNSKLQGKPGLGYYIDIGIGTPPQNVSVLIDTGSSNFAVAASSHPYVEQYFYAQNSSTFINLYRTVEVPYTQGKWSAFLGRDVTLMETGGDPLNVTAEVACITQSSEFFINGSQWQGILGLGYKAISQPDPSVTPYFDSLLDQNDINDTFSMQLCGTVDTTKSTDVSMGGTLIIGGMDDSLFTSTMHYVPIHKEWYYEVVITDISVDGFSLNMDCKEYNFDKTIVDSGTTNLRLPTKVYSEIVARIQQGVNLSQTISPAFWSRDEQLCWKEGLTPWDAFPSITISLLQTHNTTIDLFISPQQYLRAVPDDFGAEDKDCFKFAIDSSTTGSVIGAVIMEGYYVVFDRENKQMGFAQTTCPQRSAHYISTVNGPHKTSKNVIDCAYKRPEDRTSSLMIAAYVMAGICGVCVIPLVIMIVQWICIKFRQRSAPADESNIETADINTLLPEANESVNEEVSDSGR